MNISEIADIINHPLVQMNKKKLSTMNKVDFSIQSDTLQQTIKTKLGIDLSTIPMRWVKGDTPPHKDKGVSPFTKTHLIYVTDSIGNLILDGQSYPIRAGDVHVFHEGIEHSTVNTGDTERLMIGPMSETGERVGVAPSIGIVFLNNESFEKYFVYITYNLDGTITMFDLPPPFPVTTSEYEILVNSEISDWAIPSGKKFGGWKFIPVPGNEEFVPIDGNPSTIYIPGKTYPLNVISALIPHWVDDIKPKPRYLPLQFTNNAQVYYKSNSLSTGSGGSGVRNYRHKQRKT
jgi:hypothetical protein